MNVPQHILVFSIRLYQWVVSPAKTFLVGPMGQCRFTPSCSAYALEAVSAHGALRGSWLALKRLARCHPWGSCGLDPVPPVRPAHRCCQSHSAPSGTMSSVPNPAPRPSLRSRISKLFPLLRHQRGVRI